ncbi:nitrilase-related carbon-nitrogen hydrolase ['Camptotheca acuminata' phytoplasma]|uniref:nitrilase-related carbon-nitrogen hydrolase n=1 Tax='Camptotheca acuminata' phytoplasma TaxID=3239192 RepID=UPI00351A5336
MYKNGILKVEMSSPNLHIGEPFKNAQIIVDILNKSKASFVLFSELCLSSYTSGDLFFDTSFLDDNLTALEYVINNTHFEGVYFIGMPFLFREVIFNVAVVVQKGKILGIVPKHKIPNYKEFFEKRWFQSGKHLKDEIISVLGQEVPIGNILFINKTFNIVFGVEICQDLWTIESPSDLMVLNGAHLIFNLSASTEHLGKDKFRKLAVINHSRKQAGGYFYTSSGISETSNNVLFSNHKIAAVLGDVIGEKDLTNQDVSLVVDVYLDKIKHQRKVDTTFGDQQIGKQFSFLKSYFHIKEAKEYDLEEPLNAKPFVDYRNLQEQLKLSNLIQVLYLQNKMSFAKASQIILEFKDDLNSFLTLLVVLQYFNNNKKSLQELQVVLKEKKHFENEQSLEFHKKILKYLGINNIQIVQEKDSLEQILQEAKIENKLILESDNLSDIIFEKMSFRFNFHSSLYNLNVNIPNVLMVELILFHIRENTILLEQNMKDFYFQKIDKFLDSETIMKDFILYYHLNGSFKKEKIAFLLEKKFLLSHEESLSLVTEYMNHFYKFHYKKNKIAPGPKILSNSFSYSI